MKVTYKCKKCRWLKQLDSAWQDLRPKFCGNKKCRINFHLNLEQLEIIKPEEIIKKEEKIEVKAKKYKKETKESENQQMED